MQTLNRTLCTVPLALGLATVTACSQNSSASRSSLPSPLAPSASMEKSDQAARHTSADVFTHMSQGPVTQVADASATLVTTDNGAQVSLRTSGLAPGHPHTVWFAAINRPELCASHPCTPADILTRTQQVQAEVVYLTGSVVGNSGSAGFGGTIRAGDVPGGWYGTGFTNPRGATVHLILMDHGPAIPSLVSNMISTLRGGCTTASIPAAFPAAAFADGIPGPNTCRLVQFAVFEQP